MVSKDLILDSNNDLVISGGDLLIGQSDDQNIELTLVANKGQFYENLLHGYGLYSKLHGPFQKNLEKKSIRQELRNDNYNINTLTIDSDFTIEIDADKVK